jgi:peptidyl-prolyl cis-trans isomerase C
MNAMILRAVALGLALVPAVAVAMSGSKTPSEPIAAKVDGTAVPRSEVLAAKKYMPPQFRQAPDEAIYDMLLEQVVDTKILAAAARKEKLQNDPEIKRELAMIEEQVLRDAYVKRHLAKVLTEQEQRKRFDEMVAKLPEREEVRARHILVKTKVEAEAVIKALGAKGATFESVAKEKSKDGSAGEGGDLGYFSKDMMVPAFADAAFALQPGEVAKAPVQTQFGWHVIKVEDRRAAKAPPFEEVQPQLYAQLTREEALGLFLKMREKAKIERFTFDGKPAPAKP